MNREHIEKQLDRIEHSMTKCRENLIKLREKLNLTGTAGECTCPQVTLYPRGGMANEPLSIDVDCPVHGKSTWVTKKPDLPLHVRVAKALGEACWTEQDGTWRSNLGKSIPHREYPLVPDYPNDLVAAMGVLEEYATKKHLYYMVHRFPETRRLTEQIIVRIGDIKISGYRFAFLPQAICEAIVAHSEGK